MDTINKFATYMNQRMTTLEARNKQANGIIKMTKAALKQANAEANKDTAHIETYEKIVLYYETYIKIHNCEKLMIKTILSENAEIIIKIVPKLREKYIMYSTDVCEIDKDLVRIGNINGFDDIHHIKTCKALKDDVEHFNELYNLVSNYLE